MMNNEEILEVVKKSELPEANKRILDAVSKCLGELSTDKNFREILVYEVKRKLSRILVTSDERDIANDAFSHVVEYALTAIQNQTTKLLSPERLGERIPTRSDMEGYLIMGVRNYCSTRLRRWSIDQATETKNKNNEDSETNQNKTTEEKNGKNKKVKVAARARVYISSDCASDSDFWDQHISSSLNEENLDLSKAAEIIKSKGLSEEQIDLVLERISGKKFSDMAKEKGGSEDQYRKAFNRVIDKIGIDKKMVLCK